MKRILRELYHSTPIFCVRVGGGFNFPFRSVFGEKQVGGMTPVMKQDGNFLCSTLMPDGRNQETQNY